MQTVYNFAGAGEQVAFDIFRFDENGKIAEHWDNLAAKAEPTPSGRTQIDGTMELKDLDKTEANRWMKFLKKNKISYVCWNLSNKKESSSLLKSSCKKTGKFKNADLSVTGKWYRDV